MLTLTPIRAGDSWQSLVTLAAHPASGGWVAKLRLIPAASGSDAIDMVATASGADHLFSASPASTDAWTAGAYTWVLWVERGAQSTTIATSQFSIAPNLRTIAAGHDGRSLARKTLEALIEARAAWVTTNGRVRRYNINGREQEFASAAELDREITYWTTRVANEDATAHLAGGGKPRHRIVTRYQRPR